MRSKIEILKLKEVIKRIEIRLEDISRLQQIKFSNSLELEKDALIHKIKSIKNEIMLLEYK